jgi:hypothetical protein
VKIEIENNREKKKEKERYTEIDREEERNKSVFSCKKKYKKCLVTVVCVSAAKYANVNTALI